jgi:ArsR family transcriptional regulator
MTKLDTQAAIAALAALAQENRLAVHRLLVEHAPDGLTPGVIAERLGLPPATLSFHLKELSRAGLVRARAEGRFLRYRADIEAVNRLVEFLTENCCGASASCDPSCAPAKSAPAVRMPAKISRKKAA